MSNRTTNCGGNSGGETPLPIPNRAVKPACADGTAPPGGRVGSCRASRYRMILKDIVRYLFFLSPTSISPSSPTSLPLSCHPDQHFLVIPDLIGDPSLQMSIKSLTLVIPTDYSLVILTDLPLSIQPNFHLSSRPEVRSTVVERSSPLIPYHKMSRLRST